jgi:hypothetical protein
MTRTALKALAVIVVALSAAVPAKAAPDAAAYELQERCGKRASEVFYKEYAKERKTDFIVNFQSNYSTEYNKCFMMVFTVSYSKVDGQMHMYHNRYMIDVNTNAAYGSFFSDMAWTTPMECNVQQTACRSEDEWKGMAFKFMGDIPE